MKTKIIPFDLETAKKIQAGEIKGKIKTRDSKDVGEIVFFMTPLAYNVYAVIDGIPHSFTDRGLERIWDKSGTWDGDLVIEVPDNEPQFKPFDKVLVRCSAYNYTCWQAAFYSHDTKDKNDDKHHVTTSGAYYMDNEILPYEGNEHLVGKTDNVKEK